MGGIRFVGGGHTTFCGFLNMGVHVVMYFYYLMSAMGPSVQKYLWWKRYLTTMQLGQFVTFFVHASLTLFHGAMFFLLFANFYRQTYTRKSKSGSAKKTDVNGNGVVKKRRIETYFTSDSIQCWSSSCNSVFHNFCAPSMHISYKTVQPENS